MHWAIHFPAALLRHCGGAADLFRQRGLLAGALEFGEDVDAALVAFGLAPGLLKESVDDAERLLRRVHPAAQADELCIVVLPGQARGFRRPREGAPGTLDLIGSDLLAIARTTKHNTQGTWIGNHPRGRLDAERRVVVVGVVGVRAAVHYLHSLALQVVGDGVFSLETGMICC